MRRMCLAGSVAILGLSLPLAALCGSLREDVTRQSQENFPEFLQLLAIPNVGSEPADIQRNAAFLEELFRKRGFTTRQLDNPAHRPAVFAELTRSSRNAKTVLFYIHFDGQPVIPSEWHQPGPFTPVVKKRDAAGQWQTVGADVLRAQPLDHELRVFARSASDDKAPIMMLLTAIDLMKSRHAAAPVHIKVLLDPEEEMGSPSLGGMIAANRALFDAAAVVILDGPVHESGRPTLMFGNRGITQATLTVFGPRAPLHSGHYGNYAPNPAMRLARLLATMKDDDGRVLIPGYYDGVTLTDADRAALAAVGDDEAAIRKRIGIAGPDRVADQKTAGYGESLQYPSLNVRGMASAAVGEKAANIVPSEAVAELDLRTTPETDGKRLFDLIRRHVEQQGYHLVDRPPTDEERARYDRLAMLTLGGVEAAARVPMDSPVGRWAIQALKAPTAPTPAVDPVRIRMSGGTVPTDVLVEALHLPFILVPTVNGDNNQHARDENLRIGNFVTGTETIYSLFMTPWPRT